MGKNLPGSRGWEEGRFDVGARGSHVGKKAQSQTKHPRAGALGTKQEGLVGGSGKNAFAARNTFGEADQDGLRGRV